MKPVKTEHWQWFSLGTPVFSTNKTDRHGITEILLKVVLEHHNPNPNTDKTEFL
jgi:hypothetical protein